MFACVLILLIFFEGNLAKDVITPYSDAVFASETESVKLSCNYTGSVDSLHWYRQYPGSPPHFLILDYSGFVTHANPPIAGISIKHRKDSSSVDLEISSAAVSDSAVYYCALRPTVTGKHFTSYKNLKDLYDARHYVSFGNVIAPVQTDVFGTEDDNITVSCSYSSAISLQCFRSRFSAKLNEAKTMCFLEISSANVTDSVMYYCAMVPTVTGNTTALYKN
ncbi:uncharacterized protein LOC130237802 [Danio aesculapii]|uniref:uncharacterized protein LOC130237802 n=1 Tax=Danio aesculapii TaxID=1142201 RepID=UPI0024BF133B|nr:uncharacterized protein LOC130237802 [Danio aesculapii]